MREDMSQQQEVAAAWLAGIRHVLACKGCPLCLIDAPETPEADQEDQTLEESVRRV